MPSHSVYGHIGTQTVDTYTTIPCHRKEEEEEKDKQPPDPHTDIFGKTLLNPGKKSKGKGGKGEPPKKVPKVQTSSWTRMEARMWPRHERPHARARPGAPHAMGTRTQQRTQQDKLPVKHHKTQGFVIHAIAMLKTLCFDILAIAMLLFIFLSV